MEQKWKPGDVAMVKNEYGVWNQCIRTLLAGQGWVWRPGCADVFYLDEVVQDARRLVVIDPDDREQVERLAKALHSSEVGEGKAAPWENQFPSWRSDRIENAQQALREFANPTPPKPEEPTALGAVVEDAEGRRYVVNYVFDDGSVRWYGPDWKRGDDCYHHPNWRDLAAVRVLSEGVPVKEVQP